MFEAVPGHQISKLRRPLLTGDVGKSAASTGGANEAAFAPSPLDVPRRRVIVLAFDFVQFGDEIKVRTKARQRFEKTAESLGRGVHDSVNPVGIVEAIVNLPFWPARAQSGGSHTSALRSIR